MKEGIENGKVLFFRCEPSPHSEDLNGPPRGGVILNSPAPNDGRYLLSNRVNPALWASLKEKGAGYYYTAEMLEDFDIFNSEPGWRYGAGAIHWALANGYQVYVDRKQIQSPISA